MSYDPFADTICVCGQPSTLKMYVRYKYPRTEWLPAAGDPYYVHGGGQSFTTCGNPHCEADAFLACRDEIIDHHVLTPRPWLPSGLGAEQLAGLELFVIGVKAA